VGYTAHRDDITLHKKSVWELQAALEDVEGCKSGEKQ